MADLVDGRAVAKAWLIALLDEAPLERAAHLPTADLVAEAPRLCAQLLAALGSDAALAELPAAARAAGRLAGAGGPAEVVAAAEALRRATRDVVLARVSPPDDALRAALADRLAHICSVVAAAALSGAIATEPPVVVAPKPEPEPDLEPRDEVFEIPIARADSLAGSGPPWIAAIQRRLDRHATDARPFAVMAVEVDDLERMLASESGREIAFALESAERALTDTLAPADVLVRERLGRYWITTPDADERAARELAGRVAVAVADASSQGGVQMSVSLGVATCPADGATVDALMLRADEGLFTARASGVPIA